MRWRAELVLLGSLLVLLLPRAGAAQASPMDKLKPAIRVRVLCSIEAAARFALPANLLIAIAEQEGGAVGQRVRNANGTYDVGPLQFNSAYLRTLERFGITPQDVEAAGCYPYELAAWRVQRHLSRDAGDLWTRAANYHSRTPEHNARYRAAIRARAAKWARWLAEHVPTVEITEVEAARAPKPALHSEAPRVVAAQNARRPRRRRVVAERQSSPKQQTPASIVDELASFDARRRAQLLELVSSTGAGSSRPTSAARLSPSQRAAQAFPSPTSTPSSL